MSHEISVYITGKRNRMGENLTYIDVYKMINYSRYMYCSFFKV